MGRHADVSSWSGGGRGVAVKDNEPHVSRTACDWPHQGRPGIRRQHFDGRGSQAPGTPLQQRQQEQHTAMPVVCLEEQPPNDRTQL